ncbi:YciI family protein [Aestuariimicrobium soli]|uniref:YciI family protein n=1 Tax=Aestuariimicrobium soli TaxID=2035834 RepID=UPI003EBF72AC
MTMQIVTYTYLNAPDALDEVRPEHRAFLRGLVDQGSLVASGPFTDDAAAGALLLVNAASAEDATALLADDPFQREGLVVDIAMRSWDPVIGVFAG